MSRYPKVRWGGEAWGWEHDADEPPTHKVVLLSALVIERDENGEWPTSLLCLFGDDPESRYDMLVTLDAMAAAQREG